MSIKVRGLRQTSVAMLTALVVVGTAVCLVFLIVVLGLSAGNGSIGAAVAGCFVLLVIELVVAGKVIGSRRAGYRTSDDL